MRSSMFWCCMAHKGWHLLCCQASRVMILVTSSEDGLPCRHDAAGTEVHAPMPCSGPGTTPALTLDSRLRLPCLECIQAQMLLKLVLLSPQSAPSLGYCKTLLP